MSKEEFSKQWNWKALYALKLADLDIPDDEFDKYGKRFDDDLQKVIQAELSEAVERFIVALEKKVRLQSLGRDYIEYVYAEEIKAIKGEADNE
jgi:hypothetical protein